MEGISISSLHHDSGKNTYEMSTICCRTNFYHDTEPGKISNKENKQNAQYNEWIWLLIPKDSLNITLISEGQGVSIFSA